MSELKETLKDIAAPQKITITPNQIEMPKPFEPVDLEFTRLFVDDLGSINRMSFALSYIREHYPVVFDDAYEKANRRIVNDIR